MSIADRYRAYADAFEESYDDDDWSRLAVYFSGDAVYDTGQGTVHGRDALLERLKGGVDGFDRRMDSRHIEFTSDVREQTGGISVDWRVTYTRAGAPDLVIAGTETAEFEGDRIRLLRDEFTPEAQASLEKWMGQHGALLQDG